MKVDIDKDPSVTLSFEEISGQVEISERGEQSIHGGYTSTTLVNRSINDASLVFTYSDQCRIDISSFHVTDLTSHRVFHEIVSVYPNWRQVEQLRDFCSYLLLLRPPKPRG
jgi:hypothetical protein